jgi:CBS-domain-containing membrane protein
MLAQFIIWLHRAVGAGIAIAAMELLARLDGEPASRVPFVTSIVLVMALPESEAAHPYAIVAGHVLSCIAGLVSVWALSSGATAAVAGVSLATLMMLVTRSMHPPAAIDAFLVAVYALPASWLVNPVLAGAVLLASFSRLWLHTEKWLLGFSIR